MAAERGAPLRALHPGLGRLGGRHAQGLCGGRGHRRRRARRFLHRDAAVPALVVGLGRGGRGRPAGAAHLRLPGAHRADLQPVHADGAGAAAHRPGEHGGAGRRTSARRAGGRRLAAHPRGQRLRLGARPDPADRRLRHPVERGAAGRGEVRRGARARPRQGQRRGHRHDRRRPGCGGRDLRAVPAGLLGRSAAAGRDRVAGPPTLDRPAAGARGGGWARLGSRAEPDLATGRGARRRARPRAHGRPGDIRGDAGAARPAEPRRRRPQPDRARRVRQPSVHCGAYRDRPCLGPCPLMRTLLVTNDFPPRPGGIQSFVHNLAVRQPPGSVVVYASTWRGAAKFDADQPFEVVREETGLLLPTPAVARRAAQLARARGCDTVWFGAAAPLGLLARGLRWRAGITRAVAQTHGHEIGWAALPGARGLLRRIARSVDVVTYLGEYTRVRLDRALDGLVELRRLARETGLAGHVVFTGTVPAAQLPAYYAAGDVYAMPCRTRGRGLDVEGLGIVYLEASATGLPVVAGDSGGAPEAVRDGETGYVVNGRDVNAVADRVATLLADPALARRLGGAGRAWVEGEWRWELQAERMRRLLRG